MTGRSTRLTSRVLISMANLKMPKLSTCVNHWASLSLTTLERFYTYFDPCTDSSKVVTAGMRSFMNFSRRLVSDDANLTMLCSSGAKVTL